MSVYSDVNIDSVIHPILLHSWVKHIRCSPFLNSQEAPASNVCLISKVCLQYSLHGVHSPTQLFLALQQVTSVQPFDCQGTWYRWNPIKYYDDCSHVDCPAAGKVDRFNPDVERCAKRITDCDETYCCKHASATGVTATCDGYDCPTNYVRKYPGIDVDCPDNHCHDATCCNPPATLNYYQVPGCCTGEILCDNEAEDRLIDNQCLFANLTFNACKKKCEDYHCTFTIMADTMIEDQNDEGDCTVLQSCDAGSATDCAGWKRVGFTYYDTGTRACNTHSCLSGSLKANGQNIECDDGICTDAQCCA